VIGHNVFHRFPGRSSSPRNLVEGEAVFVSGRQLSLGRLGFNLVSLGAHG